MALETCCKKIGEKYRQEKPSYKSKIKAKVKTAAISDKGEASQTILEEELSRFLRNEVLKNDDRMLLWDDPLEGESEEEDVMQERDIISGKQVGEGIEDDEVENGEDDEAGGGDDDEVEAEDGKDFESHTESDDSDLDLELDCNYFPMRSMWTFKRKLLPPFGSTNVHYPISCSDCGVAFRNKQELGYHQAVHSRPVTYYCKFCDLEFNDKKEFNSHQRMHQRHCCDTCGKTFSSKTSLNQHKKIHSGIKPFSCTYCDKRFLTSQLLKLHLRIHRNEKPYKCKVCGKCFRQSSGLRSHLTVHSEERPYLCHICEKGYKKKAVLACHLEMHANERQYPCDECSKTFNTLDRLRVHKKSVHYKGEPFSCGVCAKTFSCKLYLRNHMKRHETREKKKRIRRRKNEVVEIFEVDIM